jgi:hypothetical protein
MSEQIDRPPCHVKGCTEIATETCDRCGQMCCSAHVRHLRIERREQPSDQRTRLDALARIPTRTEVYTLCIRCSTKPVQRRAPAL